MDGFLHQTHPINYVQSKIMMKIWLCLLLLCLTKEDELYQRVTNYIDPEAKCLDGSPATFYLHEGGQSDKFIIYFMEGGFCYGEDLSSTIEDCYQRSQTYLGSSTFWEPSMQFNGSMSTDPKKNVFSSWTKVYFIYCDGSLHQGHREAPIIYKNTSLYFRGNRIVQAHLDYLEKYLNFSHASKVLVTGVSAGGYATFLWADRIKQRLKNPTSYYTAPDSAVFLLYKSYKTGIEDHGDYYKMNAKLSHADGKTPMQKCNKAYKGEQWKCFAIQFSYQFIESSMMYINSLYDSMCISEGFQISCLTEISLGFSLANCSQSEMNFIEGYRQKLLSFITDILKDPSKGFWGIGCSNHAYCYLDQFYSNPRQSVNGITIEEALHRYVMGEERVIDYDEEPWPHNAQCAQ